MLSVKEKNIQKCFLFIFLSILIHSCLGNKGKNIPDVSNIEVDLELERFDKALYSLDTNRLQQEIPAFLEQNKDFSEIYLRIMSSSLPRGASDTAIIENILQPEPMRWLQDTCLMVFDDLNKEKEGFEMAFKLMKYYFPERAIPKVVTCVTALNYGAFTIEEDILGIGLDFYMGKDFPLYKNVFPDYIARSMDREHLVFRGMEAIVDDMLGVPKGNRMIDMMMHNGRKIYILDQLLPYTSDAIKMQFTEEQLAWCEEHELEIWKYFLGEDLLYSTDRQKFNKYVNPSPHSPGMPEKAPGRTANWVAWQIVKTYMKRNPDKTLQDLLILEDAQGLLNKSRYKP